MLVEYDHTNKIPHALRMSRACHIGCVLNVLNTLRETSRDELCRLVFLCELKRPAPAAHGRSHNQLLPIYYYYKYSNKLSKSVDARRRIINLNECVAIEKQTMRPTLRCNKIHSLHHIPAPAYSYVILESHICIVYQFSTSVVPYFRNKN